MVLDLLSNFGAFFWEVFAFWSCWQVCDWVLSRLKVRLRKPWVVKVEDDEKT